MNRGWLDIIIRRLRDEQEWANMRVTLRYQGTTYSYVQPLLVGSADGMYTDGNYGCDCNKSLFIGRYCDPAFPHMDCGEAIELVSLAPADEPESAIVGGRQ